MRWTRGGNFCLEQITHAVKRLAMCGRFAEWCSAAGAQRPVTNLHCKQEPNRAVDTPGWATSARMLCTSPPSLCPVVGALRHTSSGRAGFVHGAMCDVWLRHDTCREPCPLAAFCRPEKVLRGEGRGRCSVWQAGSGGLSAQGQHCECSYAQNNVPSCTKREA
jgi:hypothetical protein